MARCGVMVGAPDLRLKARRFPTIPMSGNNLGKIVHTRVPLSPNSIIRYGRAAVMPCDWEGNRRSGVALAMRYRLQWFTHLRDRDLSKGDEHPAYTPRGRMAHFTIISKLTLHFSRRIREITFSELLFPLTTSRVMSPSVAPSGSDRSLAVRACAVGESTTRFRTEGDSDVCGCVAYE